MFCVFEPNRLGHPMLASRVTPRANPIDSTTPLLSGATGNMSALIFAHLTTENRSPDSRVVCRSGRRCDSVDRRTHRSPNPHGNTW